VKTYKKSYIKRNPPQSVKNLDVWMLAIKSANLPSEFAWGKHGGKLMSIYFNKLKRRVFVEKVIRKGKKNTRVLLRSGEEILVPTSELKRTRSGQLKLINGGGQKTTSERAKLKLVS